MNRSVECPHCFHRMRVDPAIARDAVKCLKCGQNFSAAEEERAAAYGLAGQSCPSCGKDCAPDAVVCIECGYDFKTRQRHRTRHQPYNATWNSALSLGTRLLLFAVLQVVCLAGFLLGWKVGLLVFTMATVIGLWLCGSFWRVTLSRDLEGKVRLRVRRWYSFCPLVDHTFNLKNYRNVALFYQGPSGDRRSSVLGFFDDDDMQSDWFTLKIIRIDGQADTILSSSDEAEIRCIGETICKLGGLHFG